MRERLGITIYLRHSSGLRERFDSVASKALTRVIILAGMFPCWVYPGGVKKRVLVSHPAMYPQSSVPRKTMLKV